MTSYLVVVVKVQNCLGLGFILTINFCLSSNLGFQVCENSLGSGQVSGLAGLDKLVPPLLLPYSHHYKRGYLLFKKFKRGFLSVSRIT